MKTATTWGGMMKYKLGIFLLSVAAATMSLAVQAQETDSAPTKDLIVSGHGKTAIMATERQRKFIYDSKFHFSPAVRAGDTIYLSGVVAGAFAGDKPIGREEFKESVRRVFENIAATIKAAGADINQTVKIQTFHVFDSPWITIDKVAQVEVVAEVKNEFIGEPHPAWTAIGSTALFPDKGLVEIELTVYDPEG
ncbi:Rid family hydrolase [Kordiimonas sp. SCSIO 12610]|uniref:Rid family hydrolase n=1 Tax=Kordiimonas sp. SCSIO 12610 TaxID=2829597 RepID=UPI00210ACA97|nr:Rid family hydrolase [Kordiimonas sp. SCSIO 12610]UTW55973.1 hypothetical protein KFF44_03520 [Kordiimonas sp. SCSIO 12610]